MELFRRYAVAARASDEEHDVEIVAVDDAPEVVEGSWFGPRTVIARFPSKEAARAWYGSPAYQEAAHFRFAGATSNLVFVDGVDG